MEELKPDGSGSLDTCAADFCGSGVSGYESYVSAIFVWIHEQVVPIGVMTGLLGMLEFLQLCVCLGMLFTDQKNLHAGYDNAKAWAKQEEHKIANKVRHPRRHPRGRQGHARQEHPLADDGAYQPPAISPALP